MTDTPDALIAAYFEARTRFEGTRQPVYGVPDTTDEYMAAERRYKTAFDALRARLTAGDAAIKRVAVLEEAVRLLEVDNRKTSADLAAMRKAGGVPEGYVMVPKDCRLWSAYPIVMPLDINEDGPAQIGHDAVNLTWDVWTDDGRTLSTHDCLPDAINAAMLAAAPQPPALERMVELQTVLNAVIEQCAAICDLFSERNMHPSECAAAIRAMKGSVT